jgi:hypothetical protein
MKVILNSEIKDETNTCWLNLWHGEFDHLDQIDKFEILYHMDEMHVWNSP